MATEILTAQQYGIYRSIAGHLNATTILHKPGDFMRPPRNVPYVVDNLWEWKRPHEYPSRRHSAFANPQPALAQQEGPKGGSVYSVEFKGKFKLGQLIGWKNSMHHPDCEWLRRLLFDRFGQQWLQGRLADKEELGRLWIPCLTKDDMNELFGRVNLLRAMRNEVYDAITYWNDVMLIEDIGHIPDAEGELFFETVDGYYLRSLY